MSTIAAVSTPRGKGGIAVIRISGEEAIAVAQAMFQPKSGKPLSQCRARYAIYGDILDSADKVCDSGLCTLFRAPNSFTGEDCCEISCHGGTYITMTVLTSALAHGATMAGPGEFTKRAFINGKLSLTEAEAVGQLIDSDTEERMRLSAGALRGNVSAEIQRISDALVHVMTALYAAIDYPDEDIGTEGEESIGAVVRTALEDTRRLLATYKTGRAVSDGVKTVIFGSPNVGKSSLFNRMLGEDAAIVTSVAGTTRDVLRECVSFGGVTLRLSDTAGIHESGDEVEKIGIQRAESELAESELAIEVLSAEMLGGSTKEGAALEEQSSLCPRFLRNQSCAPSGDGSPTQQNEHRFLPAGVSGAPGVCVINKVDLYQSEPIPPDAAASLADCAYLVLLSCAGDGAAEVECGQRLERALRAAWTSVGLSPSCRISVGLDGLRGAVAELYGSDRLDLAHDAVIWDVRQQASLARAQSLLEEADCALARGDSIDAVCTMVESAAASLSETDGRGITEEIVDGIFHRFCVGK